jgi:type III secretion system YscI/HrpB-like protein
MKIDTAPMSTLVMPPDSGKPSHAPETSDINWFNASLNTPATQTPHNIPSEPYFARPLNRQSAHLQALSNKSAQALLKVSTSTDPIDMLNSTRALSRHGLDSILAAKVVSKTSQAVDKLTNLS